MEHSIVEIKIISLELTNFQGVKSRKIVLDGKDAELRGAFGSGKTSKKSAHTWLWYGKNPEGRSSGGKSSFAIRPLDKNNKPIPDIITTVEEVVSFNGEIHTLKKQHSENIVNGKLKGYDTDCWFDKHPCTVTQFEAKLAAIIDPQTFRLLTDPSFLNHDKQCPWQDRRNIVIGLADELPKVEGFGELHTARETLTVDEYKKVLKDSKSLAEEEQHDNSTRKDENQGKLEKYAGGDDVESTHLRRDSMVKVIAKLDNKRTEITGQQTEREAKKEAINTIKNKMAARELDLAKDTSGIQDLLNQKGEIELNIGKLRQGVQSCQSEISEAEGNERLYKRELDTHLAAIAQGRTDLDDVKTDIADIQKELAECEDIKISDDDKICFNCGAPYEGDKLQEIIKAAQVKLHARKVTLTGRLRKKELHKSSIITKGNRGIAEKNTKKAQLETVQTELVGTREALELAQELLALAEKQAKIDVGPLDEAIAKRPTKKPEDDEQWVALKADRDAKVEAMGDPLPDQLTALDADRAVKQTDLNNLNKALAAADEIEKARVRIEELTQKNRELAQTLADTQQMLDMIDEYKEAESRLIEVAVNDKFELITWKLFGEFINGNGDPCCVAILKENGNEYRDCSGGEKIDIDNDCVNVMAEHYGFQVTRFVDDFVLIDSDIRSECQTIKLITDNSCPEVKVIIDESEVSDV